MVIISKEPKRKRKQLPPIEPVIATENPKRTKFPKPQRKFAQGQGNPNYNGGGGSSAAFNTSLPGSSASNNNSKDVIITEPIMATPPPAKDFLTYVCFQRNPVFQSLNYLGKSTSSATAAPIASTSTSPVKSPLKRTSRGEDSGDDGDAKPRQGRKTKQIEAKQTIVPVKTPSKSATEEAKVSKAAAPVVEEKPSPPVKRKPGRPPKVPEVVKSESEYETASENGSEDKRMAEKTANLAASSSVAKAATSPVTSREEVSSPSVPEQKEERITRHMAWRHSYNNTPIEPTIKRKPKVPQEPKVTEPAKKEEKVPTQTKGNSNKKKLKKDEEEEDEKMDSEFSSDDDKPLVVSMTKSVDKGNNGKRSSLVKGVDEKAKKNAAVKKRKSSPGQSRSVPSTPPPPKKISKGGKGAAKETSEKKKSQKAESETEERETLTGSPKRSDSKTKRKYLSKELEKLTADISQTPTDFSENETKTTRPTRKTKEAATIYMELIGHKLNLHDTEDEDASSMDSYPELPNVKKTQQLEEECRQNMKEQKVRRGRKTKAPVENSEPAKVAPKEDAKGKGKSLNKSFSDSDEEPLATKLSKKPKKTATATTVKKSEEADNKVTTPASTAIENKDSSRLKVEPPKRSPVKLADAEDILHFSLTTFKSPVSNDNYSAIVSTPDNSKSALNRTPGGASLNLSMQEKSGWSPAKQMVNDSPVEFLRPPNKAKPKQTEAPISPIVDDTSPQNIANLMMNPLPSKEESGKIFGIASVTLAQSSGPQDTKCTLGKCGSIHKTSLGPAVPTEALLGETSTVKERRKSKVNMTQEQIQKWLSDCAAIGEQEIPPDDLADLDLLATPEPGPITASDDEESPYWAEKKKKVPPSPSQGNSSSTPVSVAPPPPVAVSASSAHQPITKAQNLIEKFEEDKDAETIEVEQSVKQIIQKLKFDEDSPAASPTPPIPIADKKKADGGAAKEKATGSGKKRANQEAEPTTPTSSDRKPIYNRRTPVYNKANKEESPKPPKTLTKQNSFGAFSPENEHSVYAFDREEDDVSPMKPPFRRKSGAGKDESPKTTRGRKASPQKPVSNDNSPQVSVALNPSSAVALSLPLSKEETPNSQPGGSGRKRGPKPKSSPKKQKNSEGDGNDSDSEGQTIYIPLQNAGVSKSGKSDQLIQGVAVKLGTEGPDGCVIMKAKLVTKSVGAVGNASMTDAKAQELMKSIISVKDAANSSGGGGAGASGSKAVPVGTVQPRFKSNEAGKSGTSSNVRSSSPATNTANKKKATAPIKPSNSTTFPLIDDPPQIVDAPVFRPTEKEFQDPMEFFERILPIASRFGLCRIVPPSSFKPECRVSDDMRFTAYNQYVHKMQNRWGSSVKEMCAIRKYLATQSIQMNQPPLITGMEVDLPRLYHTVQELGGLKEVIEKKKWARVAEEMCIPKTAHDRVTKLDDIYCKYLLPYDTLSATERQKLFDEVQADWVKREAKARRIASKKVDSEEDEDRDSEDETSEDETDEEEDDNLMECIVKGKNTALSAFFRVARNTMWHWFKSNDPPPSVEVEAQFWRHVGVRDSHVCVHSGSIDSSGWGYGFPDPEGAKAKGSACAKHPWNLKVLTNNSGSVLRSLGPVMGVTVPTLHVGMLFSACCWYRDPHGLPWMEYLHTGGSKIWYGVPDEQSNNFRTVLTGLVPTLCQNKTIWLPCDTAMVPPQLLIQRGVSLCRTEQKPGEFVIIFPRAYTSSLATGYVVSESVYFATNQWLDTAHEDFKDIQDSREPTMFSLCQLIFALAADERCSIETLKQVEPMIKAVLDKEKELRNSIKEFGVVIESRKKAKANAAASSSKKTATTSVALPEEDVECDLCRTNLFISMVRTETEDEVAYYCLQHGLMYLKKGELQAKESKLIYNHELDEIQSLTKKLSERIKTLQASNKGK